MIEQIISGIHNSRTETPVTREIYKNNEVQGKNEFLFFIKPEITLEDDTINIQAILEMIFTKIEIHNLSIRNVRIVNAPYLEKHNIIAQHYGVINKLSKNIRKYVSDEAKQNFKHLFSTDFDTAEVYGSLEFMEHYPHFTPTGISYLWQNASTQKLAGGTYVQQLSLDGKKVFIINGFHPRQLEHFIAKDRCIVTMTLTSDTVWAKARNSFIGKTNPEDAEAGSIRNELLIHKAKYGLKSVSSSWNGVHLSAGPVEGLVELMRYNSNYETGEILSASDYSFGQQMAAKLPVDIAEKIIKNPDVTYEGKQLSVFDLTEELDSDKCLNLLSKLKF